jgi:hypothetical protein
LCLTCVNAILNCPRVEPAGKLSMVRSGLSAAWPDAVSIVVRINSGLTY